MSRTQGGLADTLRSIRQAVDTMLGEVTRPGKKKPQVRAWVARDQLALFGDRGYPPGGERSGSSEPVGLDRLVIGEGEEPRPRAEWKPLAQRYQTQQDPTAAKALRDLAELDDIIDRASIELPKAARIVVAATVVTSKPGAEVDDLWCEHHARHGHSEPLAEHGRNGLCRWCDEFRRSEGVLPPRLLIEARARGERITAQLVDRALGRRRVS